MKVSDLKQIQKEIDEIRKIAVGENYNLSVAINKHLTNIEPFITNEMDRLLEQEVPITCPQTILIEKYYDNFEYQTEYNKQVVEDLNNKLLDLVAKGNKIIDYDIKFTELSTVAIIKYTT